MLPAFLDQKNLWKLCLSGLTLEHPTLVGHLSLEFRAESIHSKAVPISKRVSGSLERIDEKFVFLLNKEHKDKNFFSKDRSIVPTI